MQTISSGLSVGVIDYSNPNSFPRFLILKAAVSWTTVPASGLERVVRRGKTEAFSRSLKLFIDIMIVVSPEV